MKSRFKYFGQLTLIFILGLFSLTLPFLFAFGTTLTLTNSFFGFLYFELLGIIAIIFLWTKILTEMIQIKVLEEEIILKNIVTRKVRSILLNEIFGFKNNIWNNSVSFRDKNDQTLFRLTNSYYLNFPEMIKKLNKPYLGKEKFLSRK